MNRGLKTILVPVIIFTIMYLTDSFVYGTFNITKWSKIEKVLISLLTWGAIGASVFYYSRPKYKK
jgi:hypothetical protein